MFDIPGFNVRSFSEDDLYKKQAEISKRLAYASRFSASGQMVEQLRRMNEAISTELVSRMQKKIFVERNPRDGVCIETDPDPRILARQEAAEQASKPVVKRTPRSRRTAKPVESGLNMPDKAIIQEPTSDE